MGQNVLREVLAKIKSVIPYLYSIIDDEATDIACNEQLTYRFDMLMMIMISMKML